MDLHGSFEDIDNIFPLAFPCSPPIGTLLRLHRGSVFNELIEAFKQNVVKIEALKIEMVLPNGEVEQGDDSGGVLRDALSEFWSSFYEKCTVGTTFKVPYVRHDFAEAEWTAIGKIITAGYEQTTYFPIKLAPVFIMNCLGIESSEADILSNFLEVIADSEANLVKVALKDFESVDFEELTELVSSYDSKWVPTKNNFETLIQDIAHTELIQKPAYVSKCFMGELKKSLNTFELKMLYDTLKPTARNCLSMITLNKPENELSQAEATTFTFLKKIIRESPEHVRQALLRYCTGADLSTSKIEIIFTNTVGVRRVPIAHTCTGTLELPSTYENYLSFRSEINSLLQSNIWVMDIV